MKTVKKISILCFVILLSFVFSVGSVTAIGVLDNENESGRQTTATEVKDNSISSQDAVESQQQGLPQTEAESGKSDISDGKTKQNENESEASVYAKSNEDVTKTESNKAESTVQNNKNETLKSNSAKKDEEPEINLIKDDFQPIRLLRQGVGGPLSLDNVEITSFKIIDVAHGNTEIEYSLSSDSPYKTDPAQFSNAICENQIHSVINLELNIKYHAADAIQEGDTITIPADTKTGVRSFAEKPFVDQNDNVLGSWEYKSGEFILKFSGEYIKNNYITTFTAHFRTGNIGQHPVIAGRTVNLGERKAFIGKLGKDDMCVAYEKLFVKAKTINDTRTSVEKAPGGTTDSRIYWKISLVNDYVIQKEGENNFEYWCPYLLENGGAYSPNSFTGIYVEDHVEDGNAAPELAELVSRFSGVNDAGEVVSGDYSVLIKENVMTKIDQQTKSKDEVKAALQPGQYCIYDHKNGTYTFMMKWWDMNDPSGLKYDDIPQINAAGGVGGYLKGAYPEIYENFSDATINKINDLYRRKAVQNVSFILAVKYETVEEGTEKHNMALVTTDQTGLKEVRATALLTPANGGANITPNPLTLKMIKYDNKTDNTLSTGFKFNFQKSVDGGASWNRVTVNPSMLKTGTINTDNTLTPDVNGVIELKNLVNGNMYRFVETAHAPGYKDTVINEMKPNDKNNPTSANSVAVKVTNKSKGKIIKMYNEKVTSPWNPPTPPSTPTTEYIDLKVKKDWRDSSNNNIEEPVVNSIKVKLYRNGTATDKILELNKSNKWEGKFQGLEKYVGGTTTPYEYTVQEEGAVNGKITFDGKEFKVQVEGTMKDGYRIINKKDDPTNPPTNPPAPGSKDEKVSVSVIKKWIGGEKDSITVYLLLNGKVLRTKSITKLDNWQYTFDNLDKYVDGKLAVYTIKEDKVKGYVTTVTGNSSSGFIITNSNVNTDKNGKGNNKNGNTPPHKSPMVKFPQGKGFLPKTGDGLNPAGKVGALMLIGVILIFAGLRRKSLKHK